MSVKIRRIIMSAAGVIICGMCVAVFKIAAFGVDPFQALMSGLDQLIPIPFGTLYVIVNVVLLSFSLIFDRHYIGIATFINLFLLGYITEFTYSLLHSLIPDPSFAVRCLLLIFIVPVICIALSLYITADLGVSTYDAIALIMCNKWKIGKFKVIRVITDIICVLSGAVVFIIGGGKFTDIPSFIGIGTIITAFFTGPLIDFFNKKVSQPMLRDKSTEK